MSLFRLKSSKGFTLIELLVVIAVLGLLAGLLLPALQSSRERARQTACKNNLHQLSVGLIMYKEDYKDLPKWLSCLFPTYISQPETFLCKSDNTKINGVLAPGQGVFASKPKEVPGYVYPETNDNGVNGPGYCGRNDKIQSCSYLYEFNAAECSWYKDEPRPLTVPGKMKNDGMSTIPLIQAPIYGHGSSRQSGFALQVVPASLDPLA